MRYKPEHKEATHRKIVEAASREFRQSGFDGVGIATLMSKLKLTHGGFYAHFEDKEALVSQSLEWSFDEFIEWIETTLKAGGMPAFIELYLSEMHLNNPGLGCPVPALGAEVSRHPGAIQENFTGKLERFIRLIAEYVPGTDPAARLESAWFVLASLAGAISMARAVADPELRLTILRSTQEQLLKQLNAERL